MKKLTLLLFPLLLFSIFFGCEKENLGNYGDLNAKKHIMIEAIAEYDSLGTAFLNEYDFKILEEKDTFWLRSYNTKDSIGLRFDTLFATGGKDIVKIDTVILYGKEYKKYYNDLTKKCRYVAFDTIKLKYSNKFTQLRTLVRSNGRWKASVPEFKSPTTQLPWAFAITQYGGGDSYLRTNYKFGSTSTALRHPIVQQLYTPDSLFLFQITVTRKGLKTP